MSVRGVGEKRAVMALAAPSVQDRQPSFAVWVEAPWRDRKQPARCGLFSIFTIDVENLCDRRFFVLSGRGSELDSPEAARH
jgi:hypothetical protein